MTHPSSKECNFAFLSTPRHLAINLPIYLAIHYLLLSIATHTIMRSLPQPRYSRSRTIQRIFRSIMNLFSTGYISDSSAFAHHTVLDKSTHKTKIRTSRITGRPTPRNTMVNKLGAKIVSELIEDETLIGSVMRNEIGGFATNVGMDGGVVIVNDVNRSKNGWFKLWKGGERADLKL